MSNIAESDVLGKVLKIMESTLKVASEQLDIDANLESFGVNSLIVMEIMENIENEFDVTLTPAQFSNIDNISGLVGLLESLSEKSEDSKGKITEAVVIEESVSNDPRGISSAQQDSSISTLIIDLDNRPFQNVLNYIYEKYGFDLSYRNFDSLDSIVDELILKYPDDLMQFYSRSGQAGNLTTGSKIAPTVAIVGISCNLPDAPNHHIFWENLLANKNSIREIPSTRWNWQDHYSETVTPGKTVSKWGALIDNVDCFDASFFGISNEEALATDPQLRLLLEESYHAVEDAGIDMEKLAGSSTGVFIGYEYAEYEHHLRKLENKDITLGPLFSSSSPSYYLSSQISHTFDLCGPSESINVNCASSAVAINRAYYSLLNGESDTAIVGAASLNLFVDDYVAASQYGILSPNGTSGVFDNDANGFTRGEGVAVVVLKRLEDAEKDNNRIYGMIKSTSENYRGAARNISEVKHESITAVLEKCYEKASIDVETISYVEVDGFANKWADSIEYEGIKGIFEKSKANVKHVALGSMKGNVGNLECVSGLANVIKVALSLHHKKFPATISKKKLSTFLDIESESHPVYIADKNISFDSIRADHNTPIRAGVNSLADSGTNVHILLEEYIANSQKVEDAVISEHLFVLSAKDDVSLETYVFKYIDFISNASTLEPFINLIYTSQVGREPLNNRIAILASSYEELVNKLSLIKKNDIGEKSRLDSKGVFYGKIDSSKKIPLAELITDDVVKTQLAQSIHSSQWKQIALLWVNGLTIPWEMIWRERAVQRISLPTYPFARNRYWIDIERQESSRENYQALVEEQPEKEKLQMSNLLTAPTKWYFYLPGNTSNIQESSAPMNAIQKMELFLKQEVANQLHCTIDDVVVDKDFIELGMDSVGIAELIFKTDQLLEINITPNVLFKHPQIDMLSEFLAKNYFEIITSIVVTKVKPAFSDTKNANVSIHSEKYVLSNQEPPTPLDILITLQKESTDANSPIFAVPGAGGSALSMHQLAKALGSSQPFYCLEPVGLDGFTSPTSNVEQVAEYNIEAMQSVQRNNAYRLLGYSNGGIVAFEMARQLQERGNVVSSLIMLDTLTPVLLNKTPIEEATVAVFDYFVSLLGGKSKIDIEFFNKIPKHEHSEYLYDSIVELGIELPKKQFLGTFNVAIASEQSCRAYHPVKLKGDTKLTLFRAISGFKEVPNDYGWSDFFSTTPLIYDVDANHFTILDLEYISEIAKKINTIA